MSSSKDGGGRGWETLGTSGKKLGPHPASSQEPSRGLRIYEPLLTPPTLHASSVIPALSSLVTASF